MSKIVNPTPVVTTGTFGIMWINAAGIFLTTKDKPNGFLQATLQPYDGTHLLSTGGKRVFQPNLVTARAANPTLDSALTALLAEAQRIAGETVAVSLVTISAPDPAKPVGIQVFFADGKHHNIPDGFALAAGDTTFAGVFSNVMAALAELAGCAIQ
jgi:hypothetical protein